MAARIRDELGHDTTLIEGSGGIYEVAVEGAIVAKKGPLGFPDEDDALRAVAQALHDTPGAP